MEGGREKEREGGREAGREGETGANKVEQRRLTHK